VRRLAALVVALPPLAVGCDGDPRMHDPSNAAVASASAPVERTRAELLAARKEWLRLSNEEKPAFDARLVRIHAELASVNLPAWAGTFAGDDLEWCHFGGELVSTALAPTSGIVWRNGIHDGPSAYRNHGEIVKVDGRWIHVRWQVPTSIGLRPETELDMPELGERLWLLDWDDRELLVPECALPRFVNMVNSGRRWLDEAFPMRWKPGRGKDTLSDDVRRSDARRRPAGSPTLPPDLASWLHPEPLRATIVRAGDVVENGREGSHRERTIVYSRQRLTIDKGRADRVFPGMQLHAAHVGFRGFVTSCGEHESEVRWDVWSYDEPTSKLPLHVGTTLSSMP
jgi:hypothetical protein